MSVNRIISSIAGLSVLFSFLAVPTDCGQQQTETRKLTVVCATAATITVTTTGIPDVYVCGKGKVTFDPNGHTFSVGFKNGLCPFANQPPGKCKVIDNQNLSGQPVKDSSTPVVYDYGIVVDGQLFDPHIIGGG